MKAQILGGAEDFHSQYRQHREPQPNYSPRRAPSSHRSRSETQSIRAIQPAIAPEKSEGPTFPIGTDRPFPIFLFFFDFRFSPSSFTVAHGASISSAPPRGVARKVRFSPSLCNNAFSSAKGFYRNSASSFGRNKVPNRGKACRNFVLLNFKILQCLQRRMCRLASNCIDNRFGKFRRTGRR